MRNPLDIANDNAVRAKIRAMPLSDILSEIRELQCLGGLLGSQGVRFMDLLAEVVLREHP